MGTRGPVRGQWHAERGSRAVPPTDEPPKVPPGMPRGAARVFRRLAADLDLTAADSPLLESLAGALWLQNAALKLIEAEGLVVSDTEHVGRNSRKHPAAAVWRLAAEVVRASAMRLGASPYDRQRLPQAEQGLTLDELLTLPDKEYGRDGV